MSKFRCQIIQMSKVLNFLNYFILKMMYEWKHPAKKEYFIINVINDNNYLNNLI